MHNQAPCQDFTYSYIRSVISAVFTWIVSRPACQWAENTTTARGLILVVISRPISLNLRYAGWSCSYMIFGCSTQSIAFLDLRATKAETYTPMTQKVNRSLHRAAGLRNSRACRYVSFHCSSSSRLRSKESSKPEQLGGDIGIGILGAEPVSERSEEYRY